MRSAYAALPFSVGSAVADFGIYYYNTVTADPYGVGGLSALFISGPVDCSRAGNSQSTGWVGDASSGGARCQGCDMDADSIDGWDIEEFEWKEDDITSIDNGLVTLRKKPDDDSIYYLDWLNEDRTLGTTWQNIECVRNGDIEESCTGPALANSILKQIFFCRGDVTSTLNPE